MRITANLRTTPRAEHVLIPREADVEPRSYVDIREGFDVLTVSSTNPDDLELIGAAFIEAAAELRMHLRDGDPSWSVA